MKPYIRVDQGGMVTVSDGFDHQSMTIEMLHKNLMFMERLRYVMEHDPMRLQADPFGVIADINGEILMGEKDGL
ncbi:MAG: hypothetical protein BWY45_03484 [Euryarchaeota archaeon ADurb.Bin294]|jgi:hypothetical protein|nr:MAG: hypothetical protein BWY45_03484 [Euryarchaeota archaeon ADurb.Bin294]